MDPDEFTLRLESRTSRPDALQHMREAYARDIGMLPPEQITAIIAAGGFQPPVPLFQTGPLHGRLSRRADQAR